MSREPRAVAGRTDAGDSSKGSLLQRAAHKLEDGPAHTLDVAREVLGLSGPDGAVAAAVFHLLGTDPRFLVDADGVWRLNGGLAPMGRALAELSFAVVDVETTGRRAGDHRVTDIAIVEVRGGEIVDEYQTLINPARSISPAIVALTGITPDMVRHAPYFDHVAEEIAGRLAGKVFVAHNAAFDWGFVSSELVRAGADAPSAHRLCTVRMTRRLVPELRHRNLDVVTRHFGIEIHSRHRAYGDAVATARVLLRLLDEAHGRGIEDLTALEAFLAGRRAAGRGSPAAERGSQMSLGLPGQLSRPRRKR